ncbi:beta-lactamase family protein [Chitinophaga sp. Mgbs1]|uniref:Beta-lactamase family protein n=1 Tax=Chitinophaga solisilvae TaxID=1233460 RepID=A0A433WGV4_9BACT|nr:beta-lactamase family protein [Chitinophaga solisilvae]
MRSRYLLSLLLFLLPAAVFSQSLQRRIDTLLQGYHRQGHFDGAALVVHHGKVVYQGYFGMANRQFAIPVKSDTRFPIASVTKLFTAIMILQLQEEKKVDITQPLRVYLPDILPVHNADITIRQLLLHTSGLPNEKIGDYYNKSTPRPAVFMKRYISDTLVFTPGSKFNYNNVDYILLGAVVEKVSGKKWSEVLQEKIIRPLQLSNTGVISQKMVIPRLAYGYHNYSFGTGSAKDTVYNDESVLFENYATAGAIYSTVRDLQLLDAALYSNRLLQPSTRELMYTPEKSLGNSSYSRGYPTPGSYRNITTTAVPGHTLEILERRGNINGFNSAFLRVEKDHNTVILLCNTDTGNMEKIGDALMKVLY